MDKIKPLDFIEALFTTKKISSASCQLLMKVVSDIYLIRLRLLSKNGSEEACYGQLLPGIQNLDNQEKLSLERAYWLVLRPLYFGMQQQFIDVLFQDLDLFKWALETAAVDQHEVVLKFIAASLKEIQAPTREHLYFFKWLSKNDPQKIEVYLETLRQEPKRR